MYLKCFVCGWTPCIKTQNLEKLKENENSSLTMLILKSKSLSCVLMCCDENHGVVLCITSK
jgi:hypothetical protein